MVSHPPDDTSDDTPPRAPGIPYRNARPTPRSAPAVAFLQVTHDSAEVTEVPPPQPGSRLWMVIAAVIVVVIGGAMLFSRMSAGSEGDQGEVLMSDSLGAGGMFKTAVGGPAGGGAFAPAAPAPQPAEQVNRFANAIAQGSMDSLLAVVPSLSQEQRAFWDKEFARAAFIEAPVQMGAVNVSGDSAQVDFVIALKVLDRNTKQESANSVSQHATLVRQDAIWHIVALR
jgi:hypothetical protein